MCILFRRMYDVYLDYWIMIQIMRRIIKTRGTIFSMATRGNKFMKTMPKLTRM